MSKFARCFLLLFPLGVMAQERLHVGAGLSTLRGLVSIQADLNGGAQSIGMGLLAAPGNVKPQSVTEAGGGFSLFAEHHADPDRGGWMASAGVLGLFMSSEARVVPQVLAGWQWRFSRCALQLQAGAGYEVVTSSVAPMVDLTWTWSARSLFATGR